jgi:preprotein translocase subunit SecD
MAPTPTPTAPAATPTASAAAPAATPAPSASVDPSVVVQRSAVQQKVGAAAWAAASKLTGPVDLSTNPTAGKIYAPFAKLSGPEVNALTPEMQFDIPTIGCDQLNARPNGAIDDKNAQVVTCESNGKMFLDVAKVVGTDVSDASPQLDQQQGQWVVSLNFSADGQKKWTALTRPPARPA